MLEQVVQELDLLKPNIPQLKDSLQERLNKLGGF